MYKRKTSKRAFKKKVHSKTGKSVQYPFPRRNRVVLPGRIGVGESLTTNLRTSFFATITAPAGGIYTGYLKPGSAFDPTGDLSTIQPVGFDLFSAVFSRYKVNNCHIVLEITGLTSTAATITEWVGAAYPATDPTAVATYQGAASQSYAKTYSGRFGYQQAGVSNMTCGGGTTKCKRSFYVDNEAIVGAQGTAFDLGAPVTADPTALQFAVLPILLQAAAAQTGSTWIAQVTMFQNVTFSQRKNPVDA